MEIFFTKIFGGINCTPVVNPDFTGYVLIIRRGIRKSRDASQAILLDQTAL